MFQKYKLTTKSHSLYNSDLPDFQVKPSTSKASIRKHKKGKKTETSDESFAAEFEEQMEQTEHLDKRQIESKGTFFAIYNIFHIKVVNNQ